MKEYYKTLGLNEDATQEQIKNAYKKLALKFHPDRNKDPGAEEQFKKISIAFETLNDPEKRSRYDQGIPEDGPNVDINDILNNFFGGGSSSSNHGFGNIFEDMFGGFGFTNQNHHVKKRKASDKVINVEISLEDLYNGTIYKSFIFLNRNCIKCNGEGGIFDNCKNCNGEGNVKKTIKQGFIIQNIISPCNECKGIGKIIRTKCTECNGVGTKEESIPVEIDIEKGTPNNHKYHIQNQGDDKKDHLRGDLIFIIKELKNNKFERNGHDLIYNIDISLLESLNGFNFNVNHFNNKVLNLKSKNIVKHKQENTIEGYGMPISKSNRYGNLIIKFNVIYPNEINNKELLLSVLPDNVKHENVDITNKEVININIKKKF